MQVKKPDVHAMIAALCGAVVIVLGLTAIAGWATGLLALASAGKAYVPMAPATAVLFLLLGSVVLVNALKPGCRPLRAAAVAASIAVAGCALFILIDRVAALGIDIERILVATPRMEYGILIGRISSIAALTFLPAGAALFLIARSGGTRRGLESIAGVLSIAVIAVGATLLLGYFYGSPFFSGKVFLPVAPLAAFAFVFLGAGTILTIVPEAWPLSLLCGTSVRARLLRAFLPTVVAVIMLNELLEVILGAHTSANPAVSSAAGVAASILLAALVVEWLSHRIGASIERAENALRTSEERYRIVVENAHDAIFVIEEGVLRFCNATAAAETGFSVEEMVGRSFLALAHPEDREVLAERHRRRMAGEEIPPTYHFRFVRRNGEVRFAEVNIVMIEWEGKPATLNFLQDVTERKRAEEALRERMREIEQFDSLMIGREQRIIEVKEEVNALLTELGRAPKYGI